jgi:large subunit ribosomal protein L4
MELKMLSDKGDAGTVQATDHVFAREFNESLVHQIVVAFQANARIGSRAQKDRGAVRHSTKKPWRQKGTGSARQGSLRSPQFRGGARIFGPVVRSHETGLPKKVRKLALKTALSSKQADGRLIVIDEVSAGKAKTADLVKKLGKLGWQSALIIGGAVIDENFKRAASNIPNLDVLPQQGANVYDILRRDTLVLTKDAVEHLQARLK